LFPISATRNSQDRNLGGWTSRAPLQREWTLNKRLEAVVPDIVEGVRGALTKRVTFDRYRQGIAHIMRTVDQRELPLLIDVLLNTTILSDREPPAA
jgi:hypothetical protein